MPLERDGQTRILLVDDHKMFADAMAGILLQFLPDASIATVNSGREGLAWLKQQPCCLVVLDLGLPDMDGLAMLEGIRTHRPQQPVLVCTAEIRPAILKRCLQAGANGLITKSQPAEEVRLAIQSVLAGRRYIAPEAARALELPDIHEADLLTERQLAIVALMQQGLTTPQIAEKLFLSPNTVKTHIRLMFEKLGVRNRVECLREARERGYLTD